MPDDRKKRGGQDRTRVDVSKDDELQDWSEKFNVTRERLKEAVQAVGDRTEAVQAYLAGGDRRRSSAERAGRTKRQSE